MVPFSSHTHPCQFILHSCAQLLSLPPSNPAGSTNSSSLSVGRRRCLFTAGLAYRPRHTASRELRHPQAPSATNTPGAPGAGYRRGGSWAPAPASAPPAVIGQQADTPPNPYERDRPALRCSPRQCRGVKGRAVSDFGSGSRRMFGLDERGKQAGPRKPLNVGMWESWPAAQTASVARRYNTAHRMIEKQRPANLHGPTSCRPAPVGRDLTSEVQPSARSCLQLPRLVGACRDARAPPGGHRTWSDGSVVCRAAWRKFAGEPSH